jgi:hypothetical protein
MFINKVHVFYAIWFGGKDFDLIVNKLLLFLVSINYHSCHFYACHQFDTLAFGFEAEQPPSTRPAAT